MDKPKKLKTFAMALALACALCALPSLAIADTGSLMAGSGGAPMAAQGGIALDKQDVDYISPDGMVKVAGITSGMPSYDSESKTLTLSNVVAGDIIVLQSGTLTLDLIGTSKLYREFHGDFALDDTGPNYYGAISEAAGVTSSLCLTGTGSFSCVACHCKGNLTVSGGTTSSFDSFNCNNLVLSGGTLAALVYCSNSAIISDGTVRRLECKGDVTVKSGSVTDGLRAKDATISDGTVQGIIECQGAFVVSGGSIVAPDDTGTSKLIRCSSLTVAGGTVKGAKLYREISCSKAFTMKNGSISGDVSCSGSTTVSGGTLTGSLSCTDALSVTGGTIAAPDKLNSGDFISCRSLTVDGGTIETPKINASQRIHCSESFTMKTGSVTGALSSKNIAVTGGSFKGSISDCSTIAAEGGKLDIVSSISCEGDIVLKNPTVQGNVTGKSAVAITRGSVKGNVTGKKTVAITGGSVEGNVTGESTVTITRGSVKGNVSSTGKLTLAKCEVNGKVSTKKDLALSYATIKTNNNKVAGVSASGNITMSGGSITANKSNGKSGISCSGNFTLKKGTVKGTISCGGKINVAGGKILVSLRGTTAIKCKNFSMKKGKIQILNADTGIYAGGFEHENHSFVIKGGTVIMKNISNYGIAGRRCNATIKGGKILITGSYKYGIRLWHETYRGKTHGGKLTLSGGSLTSTGRKGTGGRIQAREMSNEASCLKAVNGRLPRGATFKTRGNTYKVSSKNNQMVGLVKRGPKASDTPPAKVEYGGVKYSVSTK